MKKEIKYYQTNSHAGFRCVFLAVVNGELKYLRTSAGVWVETEKQDELHYPMEFWKEVSAATANAGGLKTLLEWYPGLAEQSESALDLTKPMQTRDGHKARFFGKINHSLYPLVFSIKRDGEDDESVIQVDKNGKYCSGQESANDIINTPAEPEKLQGWVNVYPNRIYGAFSSQEVANAVATEGRIACIDLSQFNVGHGLDKKS